MKRWILVLPCALAACPVYGDLGFNPTSSTTTSTGTGGTGGAPLCVPGTEQACYSGPAGTEGQGICEAGKQLCAADGMSFGPCSGEVLPHPENCATPIDEDCDGLAPPCIGNVLWAKRFGEDGDQIVRRLAVDSAGNVIVTGYFSGSVDFGGGLLSSPSAAAGFVAKLDASGNHVWAFAIGDSVVQGESLAVDHDGSVLIAGSFTGSVDFGGGPLVSAGMSDIFVAKLHSDGSHAWSESFGDVGGESVQALTVDGLGNVIVSGTFEANLDFGDGSLTSTGSREVYLAKLDSNGVATWSHQFGSPSLGGTASIATDSEGSVLLTGYFSGTLDFGGGPLSSNESDVFVAKLDAGGAHLWSKRFGGLGSQNATDIAIDEDGSALVAGEFTGDLDFGGGLLANLADGDLFLAKLDADGNHEWSRRFGDTGNQTPKGIAIDSFGNIVLTGHFNGAIDFGGGPLQSATGQDVFIAKLGRMGEHLWSKRFGDALPQVGIAVAVDRDANLLLAGRLDGSIDFGGGALVSAGGADIFVVKLGP